MDDQTYNGWTNYETWNVKLWIDNDHGAYDFWREGVSAVMGEVDDEAQAVYQLAEQLKDFYEENMPEVEGLYRDLLQASLDSVNWREIAHNMIDEFNEGV